MNKRTWEEIVNLESFKVDAENRKEVWQAFMDAAATGNDAVIAYTMLCFKGVLEDLAEARLSGQMTEESWNFAKEAFLAELANGFEQTEDIIYRKGEIK